MKTTLARATMALTAGLLAALTVGITTVSTEVSPSEAPPTHWSAMVVEVEDWSSL